MIWLRMITFMVVTCLCALIVSGLLEDLKVYKRDNDHLLILAAVAAILGIVSYVAMVTCWLAKASGLL